MAVDLAEKALDLAPESAIARFHLARLLTAKGLVMEQPSEFILAQTHVDWLCREHPHHPLAHQAAGQLLMARARYFEEPELLETATVCFRRAAELDPSQPGPWSNLSSALFMLAGITEREHIAAEAVHAAGHAYRLRPWASREKTELALALIRLGELSFAAAPLEQAIDTLESLIAERGAASSEVIDWRYHLGCAYDFLGDTSGQDKHYAKAIEQLEQVVEADPSRSHAQMNLAQAHLHLGEVTDDVEQILKAIEYFNDLSKVDRDSWLVWEEWGVALMTLSELMKDPAHAEMSPLLLREAEEKLMSAGALGSSTAWFNLGCLYALAGEPQSAVQALMRCHRGGMLPTAREIEEHPWLVSLHGDPEFQRFMAQIAESDG
jgi:tetratricopeptide (TPR) repeat protein